MKRKSGIISSLVILAATLLLCAPLPNGFCADPPWRVEFDETCANTSDAMALSQADLQALIVKCDRLQKSIEQLDESTRKVFLKRLHMCKNLFQYVLDAKKRTPEQIAQ
jgi:uncharacterized lipoprotein YajG